MCERGSYAHAFQLKVEEPRGTIGDDTALNSVRLYCQAATSKADSGSVASTVQCWGEWLERRACEPGTFLHGVRLWVEEPQGVLDDVGATDVDMVCSDGRVLYGGGACWGDHSGWFTCPQGYAICGIRTRVEGWAGLMGDNTALNDLMMVCCELP
ncbi:vitelline membrane outer layer protein 1 homolog [Portunus trituberculatus]|uniref:vitelline membrane outer layer protein 1 homolog n=1 Tax=Portunus trituberculatus TaxID=210409 RepID=UPI001E1D09E8|nr:vitelline membrane outer layer protein 1 homolog [Portunus trituberculatus]